MFEVEPAMWTVVITAVSAVISAFIGAAGIGLRVVSLISTKINEIRDDVMTMLTEHEDQDQHRHEDNIQRFAVMETQLKTIINNGNHK